MTPADILAMLDDITREHAVCAAIACAIVVMVAAVVAAFGRAQIDAYLPEDEAGDTHAKLPPCASAPQPKNAQRMRDAISRPLKPSYDARAKPRDPSA